MPVLSSLTAKWRRVKIGSSTCFLRAHHARNVTPPLCPRPAYNQKPNANRLPTAGYSSTLCSTNRVLPSQLTVHICTRANMDSNCLLHLYRDLEEVIVGLVAVNRRPCSYGDHFLSGLTRKHGVVFRASTRNYIHIAREIFSKRMLQAAGREQRGAILAPCGRTSRRPKAFQPCAFLRWRISHHASHVSRLACTYL